MTGKTEKEAAKPMPNDRLRKEREKRGWSRDYVAEKIGGDPRSVGRWERGTTSPSPYYRQRLCELFEMNAEELGFFKEAVKDNSELHTGKEEPQAAETNIEMEADRSATRNSSRLILGYRGLLGLIAVVGAVVVISTLIIALFSWKILGSSPSVAPQQASNTLVHIRPGGLWVNPASGQIVHGVLHYAAQAYPTNPGDPTINHVNFTVGWQGHWKVACIAYPPAVDKIFICDANLGLLGAPAGQIKVSFDVYDQNGNVNFSPNGVHTIVYYSS